MSLQINTQPVQFSSSTKFDTLTASIFYGASGLNGHDLLTPTFAGAGGYIDLRGGDGFINDVDNYIMSGDGHGATGGYINLRGGGGGQDGTSSNGGIIEMTGAGGGSGGGGSAGRIYGNAGEHDGNAGCINISGAYSSSGGSINTSAADNLSGGDINTSASSLYVGGSINTSGSHYGSGGYINTSGGGNIDTSDGGGYIKTSGMGGYINTSNVGEAGSGGYIDTAGTGTIFTYGGFIKTSGGHCQNGDGPDAGAGGYINTSGSDSSILGGYGGDGGYVNTKGCYNIDGGSINTSSGGSINTSGSFVRKLTISGATISDANGDYYSNDNGVTWDNNVTGYEIVFTAHDTNDLDGKLYSDDHSTLLYQATAVDNLFNVGNWDIYFGNSGTPFSSIVNHSYQILGGSINTSNGGGSINTTGSGYIQFGYNTFRTILSGTATQNRNINLPNFDGTLVIATTGIKLGSLQEATSVSGTLSTFQLTNAQGTILGYIPVYPTVS